MEDEVFAVRFLAAVFFLDKNPRWCPDLISFSNIFSLGRGMHEIRLSKMIFEFESD